MSFMDDRHAIALLVAQTFRVLVRYQGTDSLEANSVIIATRSHLGLFWSLS